MKAMWSKLACKKNPKSDAFGIVIVGSCKLANVQFVGH